jgi:hypothetical protein
MNSETIKSPADLARAASAPKNYPSSLTPPESMTPPDHAKIRPEANIGEPWEKYLNHQTQIKRWAKIHQDQLLADIDQAEEVMELAQIAAREKYIIQIARDFLQTAEEYNYFVTRLQEAANWLNLSPTAIPTIRQTNSDLMKNAVNPKDVGQSQDQLSQILLNKIRANLETCLQNVISGKTTSKPHDSFDHLILAIPDGLENRYNLILADLLNYTTPENKNIVDDSIETFVQKWGKTLVTEIALRLFADLPFSSQYYVTDQVLNTLRFKA